MASVAFCLPQVWKLCLLTGSPYWGLREIVGHVLMAVYLRLFSPVSVSPVLACPNDMNSCFYTGKKTCVFRDMCYGVTHSINTYTFYHSDRAWSYMSLCPLGHIYSGEHH